MRTGSRVIVRHTPRNDYGNLLIRQQTSSYKEKIAILQLIGINIITKSKETGVVT